MEDRYEKILGSDYSTLSPTMLKVSELLYNRRATVEQLKITTDKLLSEKYVKYLEMIENEIKKALILE